MVSGFRIRTSRLNIVLIILFYDILHKTILFMIHKGIEDVNLIEQLAGNSLGPNFIFLTIEYHHNNGSNEIQNQTRISGIKLHALVDKNILIYWRVLWGIKTKINPSYWNKEGWNSIFWISFSFWLLYSSLNI